MVGGNGGGRMAILILELNCRKGKRVKVEEKCVFLGTELISGWRINFSLLSEGSELDEQSQL